MRRLGRFAVVAGAGVLVLSMFGCTPDEPGPGSTPDLAPSSPVASPTESDEDRAERERGEHAIEVYEKADDELQRLLREGADQPSAEFKKYADATYLDAATQTLQQIAEAGAHLEGEIVDVGSWIRGTPSKDNVSITSCQDATDSRYVSEQEGPGEAGRFTIQQIEVEPVDGETWKVTYVESEGYESFDGTDCADVA